MVNTLGAIPSSSVGQLTEALRTVEQTGHHLQSPPIADH